MIPGSVNSLFGAAATAGYQPWGASTVWNSADMEAGITLSGGDLTAAMGAGYRGVRATTSHATGKWRYQLTINSFGFTYTGVATIGATFGFDADANAWVFKAIGGAGASNPVHSSANGSPSATVAAGDVIDFYFDFDAGTMKLAVNGTGVGTSSQTISAGTYYPATMIYSANVTANFGGSAFTHPAVYF